MTPRHPTRTTAIALIELLVCMGIASAILGIGSVSFVQVIRLRSALDGYHRRLDAGDYFLRMMARDVRSAKGSLQSAREFRAGAATLILTAKDQTIIYHVTEQGVERIELRPDRRQRTMVLDAAGVRVRFGFEGAAPGAARSVVTTVEWNEPPKIGITHPTLSLRIAPRNG